MSHGIKSANSIQGQVYYPLATQEPNGPRKDGQGAATGEVREQPTGKSRKMSADVAEFVPYHMRVPQAVPNVVQEQRQPTNQSNQSNQASQKSKKSNSGAFLSGANKHLWYYQAVKTIIAPGIIGAHNNSGCPKRSLHQLHQQVCPATQYYSFSRAIEPTPQPSEEEKKAEEVTPSTRDKPVPLNSIAPAVEGDPIQEVEGRDT